MRMVEGRRHLRFARFAVLGVVAWVLLALGAMSGRADAAYEQVEVFGGVLTAPLEAGVFPEETQLGGVGGLAVNESGAGGVKPGTVYAATNQFLSGGASIARFEPEAGAKPKFVEAWALSLEAAYERCGPLLHTSCPTRPEGWGDGVGVGVSVDQATGDVYVFRQDGDVGYPTVAVYSADGSEVISRFAIDGTRNETTEASPEKVHGTFTFESIAVNSAGDVYLFDDNLHADGYDYGRVMEFVPQTAGDYADYVYAGPSHDIAVTHGTAHGGTEPLGKPAVDASGDVYVAGEEIIEEFDPAQPATPICSFTEPAHGIAAMTIGPDTGEVFFYNSKDKEVHRLASCDGEGEFVEVETVGVSPVREGLFALAFDPAHAFSPFRPSGILYGATPNPVGEKGTSALGFVFAGPLEVPPVVEGESVSDVTSGTAVLHSTVNGNGSSTRYVFQYVADSKYKEDGETFAGATEIPLGGAVLPKGQGGVAVSAALMGLAPGAEYRYRIVAVSHCSSVEPARACEAQGAVQDLHTFPVEAGGLPDGRGYELVSPAVKLGEVIPADFNVSSCGEWECKTSQTYERFPMQSAPDGESVVYEGTAFSQREGPPLENEYIVHRNSQTGWQTTDLTPSLLASKGDRGYMAFDPGLTRGLIEQYTPVLAPGAPVGEGDEGFGDLYSQLTGDPASLVSLLTEAPLDRAAGGPEHFEVQYAGTSADLSRVFFSANDALTGETPFAPTAVDGGAGKDDLYEWHEGRLSLVNVDPGNGSSEPGAVFGGSAVSANAVSRDGSHVYWSSETGQVYVRIDGERTLRIEDPGHFLSASADGSHVLLDDGCLYVPAEERCEDLTKDEGGAHQGGFQGIVGQSEDLSHIYFIDTKILTGADAEGRTPNEHGPGEDNLYVWEQSAGTRFIATLTSPDDSGTGNDPVADWASTPAARTAEASPDGRWLAFLSHARLTGYENTGPCESNEEAVRQSACPEVFLYNSTAGRLVCPSCNPSGASPLGWSTLRRIDGGTRPWLPQPRYLTDAGRLFFDSQDSLVPEDTNGGVEDVYEFEPAGVGSCSRSGGCVSLISAGTGSSDSNFLTMDETGRNAFFTTRDRLVTADEDDLIDLYDAREGGGHFAPATVSGGCGDEVCPSAHSFAGGGVVLSPASSLSFQGAGDLTPPPLLSQGGTSKPKSKPLTRTQKLAKALEACRKQPRRKRAACERAAHKRYGSASAKRTSQENGRKGR